MDLVELIFQAAVASTPPDDTGIASLRARVFVELRASGWSPAGALRGPATASQTSDSALLEAFLRGDSDAFNVLFERHARRLNGYARRWLGGAEAEDVVQDAFVVLFVRAEQLLERDDANVGGFLFITARNTILRALARKSRETPEPEPHADMLSQADDGLTAMLRREGQEQLAHALDGSCNPLEQQVMLLDLQDHDDATISRTVDITPGHVRVVRHRALAKLRRALEQEPP